MLKVRSYVPDVAIVDVRMPPGNADDGLRRRRRDPARPSRPSRSSCSPSTSSRPTCSSSSATTRRGSATCSRTACATSPSSSTPSSASRPAAPRSTRRSSPASSAGAAASLLDELTDRERDVLTLIAEGRSNRAIAEQLFLSPRAVERHVQAIFQKLRLPDSEDDNRRVLAVLALLGH